MVEDAWLADERVIVNPFQRVASRLRRTAKRLRSWSDRFIGNNKLQILVATGVIFRFDVAMESRSLSVEERGLRALLKKLLGWNGLSTGSGHGSFGIRRAMPTLASSILMPVIAREKSLWRPWRGTAFVSLVTIRCP